MRIKCSLTVMWISCWNNAGYRVLVEVVDQVVVVVKLFVVVDVFVVVAFSETHVHTHTYTQIVSRSAAHSKI